MVSMVLMSKVLKVSIEEAEDKEGYDDDDDDDLCRYLHNITSLCRPPLLPAGWMLTPGLCAATDWWPD